MKKIFGKLCLGGVLLFSLSMSLTSCEDILGEWSRPTPNPVTPGGGGSSASVSSLTFTVTNLKLGLNSTTPETLTATISPSDATITWSSSDDAVATVDATGKVTPVAVGTATITAKAGDKTAECPVYVYAGKASINDGDVTVTSGEWYIEGDGTKVANTITIAAGASAILDGININNSTAGTTPCIVCEGNATITLADGSTNTVTAPSGKAGIQIGGTGTLTINGETAGTGILNATGGSEAAGIGTNKDDTGGNIVINGGRVTATGGANAAGIGTGNAEYNNNECGSITINGGTVTAKGVNGGAGIGTGVANYGTNTCGAITINGGTVTATGGGSAAGIGTGYAFNTKNECGAITIDTGVTSVTATKGTSSPNSIGTGEAGDTQKCGTITIGGKEYWDGSAYQNGGGTKLPTSPYIYPTPVPSTAINGKFTINASGDQVYFAKGNLQAVCASADGNAGTQETFTWQFAANQYDFIGNAGGNKLIDGNGSVSAAGTVDLFGWSTAATYYGIHDNATESPTVYSGAFVDWGGTIGPGWRTLTKDEWNYLFSTRTSGSKVNGMSPSPDNARYTHATINTDNGSGGIRGMILFPDGVTINSSDATSWGGINQYSNWYGSTKCTTSQWNALAAKGFVFLPTAGSRNGTTIGGASERGYYWSSYTASPTYDNAHYTRVVSAVEPTTDYDYRKCGFAVRLVYPID